MLSFRLGGGNLRKIFVAKGEWVKISLSLISIPFSISSGLLKNPVNLSVLDSSVRICSFPNREEGGVSISASLWTVARQARTYPCFVSSLVSLPVGSDFISPFFAITLHRPQIPSPPHEELI